jgi:hypothetical protein
MRRLRGRKVYLKQKQEEGLFKTLNKVDAERDRTTPGGGEMRSMLPVALSTRVGPGRVKGVHAPKLNRGATSAVLIQNPVVPFCDPYSHDFSNSSAVADYAAGCLRRGCRRGLQRPPNLQKYAKL